MKLPQDFVLPVGIFLFVFSVHFLSPVSQWGDSRWIIPTAMSILKERNADLNEYKSLIEPDDATVETVDNHLYTVFPIGTAVLIVPLLFVAETISSRALGFSIAEDLLYGTRMPGLEIFFSSIVVAIVAVFTYLVGRKSRLTGLASLFLAFIFAFCTSAWSTGSRALWQHGPSMLCFAITLYLIILAQERPSLIQYISLPLAFSYVIRPTNSIVFVILSVFVLVRYRSVFWHYVAWSLVVAVPFVLYNLAVYHALVSPYYMPGRIGVHPNFFLALAGNVMSPARGLFVFTPVFLFSIAGVLLNYRENGLRALDIALCAIMVLHWIVISSFPHWWGGYSYGPRMFSDMTPFFTFFLVPVITKFRFSGQGIKRTVLVCLFILSTGLSLGIHMRGATSNGTMLWNRYPLSVDEHPERLWSWRDLQFLRAGDVFFEERPQEK